MKKHLLKLMGILAISASAYAIAPDFMGPPETQGNSNLGSTAEVRVTANVVAGIAVNEASPIDFGNLVRGKGVYKDLDEINERTPGLVVFRADKSNEDHNGEPQGNYRETISAYLNTDTIDLIWQSNNGSNGSGTETSLKNIKVTGLGAGTGSAETIKLVEGQAKRTLRANFKAYDNGTGKTADQDKGNLGKSQKLGSYLGSVVVHANVK